MAPLLLIPMALSCSHFAPKVVESPDFNEWGMSGDVPKVFAILPFTNETKVPGLNQLVREGFYEYFSVRSFHDVEMSDMDEIIKNEDKDFNTIPPKELGRLLTCDALVYGKVTRFRRIFLLLYSQMLLEAEIRIVEAESGKELWKHTFAKRFHEGGVPTGPFGVIPTAIRTTYSLRTSRRNKDIDTFCKDLVSCIPKLHSLHARKISEPCDLQVASFKLKEGASTIFSKLSQQGYKPFLTKIDSKGETWYNVMLGPFDSRKEALHCQVKVKSEFSFLSPAVVGGNNEDSSASK